MSEQQTDKVFPQGIMFKKPREGAPDFVKGSLSVKKGEFIAYLQKLDANEEWANFDLKKSKGGKLYFDLNDWKPEAKADATEAMEKAKEAIGYPTEDINPDDIPF